MFLCLCDEEELCELKEKPLMLADTLTLKERESLEEKEEPGGDAEKEEKEVTEEKEEEPGGGGGGGAEDEEQEVEELRAQVIQLLVELEETREVSQRHEESFMELQGQRRTYDIYNVYYYNAPLHHRLILPL